MKNQKSQQACLGSNAFWLASHVIQGSSIFSGTKSFIGSAVLQFFLRWWTLTSGVVQETSDGYLLTSTASVFVFSF